MQDRGIDFKSLSETSRLAVAAAGLAGMEPTPDALALLARLDRGELTADEAVDEVVAHFAKPAN